MFVCFFAFARRFVRITSSFRIMFFVKYLFSNLYLLIFSFILDVLKVFFVSRLCV